MVKIKLDDPFKDKCYDCFVCFDEIIIKDNFIYLFTKYIEVSDDLIDYVTKNYEFYKDNINFIVNIMLGIAKCVKILHDNKIVHLDIKLENILMRSDDKPILIDYGFSCVYDILREKNIRQCENIYSGTIPYAGPELMLRSKIEDYYKCDVYSLGSSFFSFVTSYSLMDDSNQKELYNYYNGRINPPLFESFKREYKYKKISNLINDMLNFDPKIRCDINHVIDVLQNY